jgi:hypothetical protein
VKVKTTENGVVVAAPSDPNLLDWINLPAFTVGAPADKTHWKYDSKASLQGVALEQITDQIERLNTLKESGLSAEDILFALVEHRVLPLQWRSHKICWMSGNMDPTRTSIIVLNKKDILQWVRAIAKYQLEDDWSFGLEPYNRTKLLPRVRFLPTTLHYQFASNIFI